MNDIPFRSEGEYLDSLFALLDLLIFREPRKRPADSETDTGTEEENADILAGMLRDRLEMTKMTGPVPVMEQVLEKLDAPEYMRYVLAFLLRCALDNAYETRAAAVFGKESMTLYDLCVLLAAPVEKNDPPAICGMLEEGRDALQLLFPQLEARERRTGQSLAGMLPVMDGRLLAIFMGQGGSSPLSSGMTRYLPKEVSQNTENTETTASLPESTGESHGADLLAGRMKVPAECAVLWGPEGSGKKETVCAFADRTKQGLVFYEVPKPTSGEGILAEEVRSGFLEERTFTELSLLLRECVLSGNKPVITGMEKLSEKAQKELVLWLQKQMVPRAGTVYLLAETEEVPDYLEACYFLPMEELRAPERIRVWREALPESAGISQDKIEALANTFRLTRGQIRDAAAQALRLTEPGEALSEDLLYQVCYAKLGHPLKGHTQRVKSPFAWDDLKMNPAGKAMLRDLVNTVRYRHIVMQEWNFEKKVPYGAGITALFAGPPGTGKTMAAQVIANELHMELYKVDLSQLMDKYVGETEKNIRRVFTEAGRSNSVLFFDEADAIFNRRLEAGNSNDRFANIETSLLLQCIEEFDGVTLLATNNMTAIDPAFLRRFRFYVQFWEPDEEIRFEIWSSVFPKEAPLAPELDFGELARNFSFTGAVIKNVAMQAAYLAAESGKPIGPLEVMVAIKRELAKEHRMLAQEEMGRYGDLFPQVMAWNSGD